MKITSKFSFFYIEGYSFTSIATYPFIYFIIVKRICGKLTLLGSIIKYRIQLRELNIIISYIFFFFPLFFALKHFFSQFGCNLPLYFSIQFCLKSTSHRQLFFFFNKIFIFFSIQIMYLIIILNIIHIYINMKFKNKYIHHTNKYTPHLWNLHLEWQRIYTLFNTI